MKPVLSEIDPMSLRYIIKNMRAADRAEIFATRQNDDEDALATDCMASEFKWMLSLDRPVCVWGAWSPWPNMWNVWMFATDAFPKVGLSLTKFVKNSEIPLLKERGLLRAECKSLATHTTAHRWMEATGAVREARHSSYGREGEAFYTYAWIF